MPPPSPCPPSLVSEKRGGTHLYPAVIKGEEESKRTSARNTGNARAAAAAELRIVLLPVFFFFLERPIKGFSPLPRFERSMMVHYVVVLKPLLPWSTTFELRTM